MILQYFCYVTELQTKGFLARHIAYVIWLIMLCSRVYVFYIATPPLFYLYLNDICHIHQVGKRIKEYLTKTRFLLLEHIGRLARMSVFDTEVDGSNPGSSRMFSVMSFSEEWHIKITHFHFSFFFCYGDAINLLCKSRRYSSNIKFFDIGLLPFLFIVEILLSIDSGMDSE